MVIGPGRIVTGAHVVANATFVQVKKPDDPGKAVARVAAISHDSDLALLEVEDRSFTRGIPAVKLGELPELRDEVAVVGYPVGGDDVSITEGVVSRIEVQRYEHSQRNLLAITVDAAINAGNSGGPVFCRGKVVGIAFQGMPDAENIGEMVPAALIRRFLEGVRRKLSPRVPGLGTYQQLTENPAMRRWLGLRESDGGLLITDVQYGSSAWGELEKGDVLLALDGQRIAANGTIRYQGRLRCHLEAVFGDHFVGERVKASLLRKGKRLAVTLTMQPHVYLVPRCEYESDPAWFQFGGLVFQRLTAEYLRTWGDNWWDKGPKDLLYAYYSGLRTSACQELVVLTQVLADEVNAGYEEFHAEVVVEANGKQPRDLADFVRILDAARREVVLRLQSGCVLLLDAAAARKAEARILAKYRVPADRSADLGK